MAGTAKPLRDLIADLKWLIEKGRGDEPAVLYMPRIEAQRRKVNKEQRKRVVFVMDPTGYAEWNTERDRWITLCGDNPTVAYKLMIECLSKFSDDMIRRLAEGE